MAPEPYETYLNSFVWSNRRAQYEMRHDRICSICNSTLQVELHHQCYDRVGKELDVDLAWLCNVCHERLHEVKNFNRLSLEEAYSYVHEEFLEDEEALNNVE